MTAIAGPRDAIVGHVVDTADATVLAVAPAGYGKTTAFVNWAARDPREFVWVRLTPDHDSGAKLARAVTAAVHGAQAPLVLVLDDAQHLKSESALAVLARLIEKPEPDVQLAIASRRQLGLPLARLRAEQRVLELTTADLVLSEREVGAMAAAAGLALDQGGRELLAQRTEGWPAGVRLAALALRGEASPRRALARFGGDDRLVVDYVRDELLDELEPEWKEFVLQSSVITRLSGPACDYVLQRDDSALRLRELSRMNVLVVPLDRTDNVYRYHALLAEALRAELRTIDPELERQLHARASQWFSARGDRGLAISHAMHGDDIERAGELVWDEAPSLLGYGQVGVLVRRLARFSREQVAESATLSLSAATTHLARGDRALAEHHAAAAKRLLRTDVESPEYDNLAVGFHCLRAVVADDLATTRSEAGRAYELAPDDSAWRAFACLVEGTGLRLAGYAKPAQLKLEEGARRGAAAGPAIQVLCLAELALQAIDHEEWDVAERLSAIAQAQIERVGLGEYATMALVFAVSAAAHAHAARPDASHRDARQADRLLERLAGFTPAYYVQCRIALAWAALRAGETTRARDLLALAERDLCSLPDAVAARASLAACRTQLECATTALTGDSEQLTTAELRVLQYLPTHLSFPEIADELYVSRNTVKTHVRAVYRKLTASSRSEAVHHAREAGLLDSIAA